MTGLGELINARYGKAVAIEWDGDESGQMAALLGRRSIRDYKTDSVPDDLIDALIACAQSAPTKSNLQQYSIIVVKDAEVRRRLAQWCPRTPILETVPALLIFCADTRRNQRIGTFRAKPHRNDNMDTFLSINKWRPS